MNRLTGILVALLALTGCFGGYQPHYVPYTPSTYTPPPEPATPAASAVPDPSLPGGCWSEIAPSTGDLAKDLLGTWQDWGDVDGLNSTDKVTVFKADGTVTLSTFPADEYGSFDESKPPTLEFAGKWELLADARLSITWDDGVIDVTPAAVSLVTLSDCTMLAIDPGPRSRIPSKGQLERVACTLPSTGSSPGIVK